MTGLAAEVAKNVALAGVGALHLIDSVPVVAAASASDCEATANFLLTPSVAAASRAHASVARLAALNPNVRVTAECANAAERYASDAAFFARFDAVCAFGASLDETEKLDALCRAAHAAATQAIASSANGASAAASSASAAPLVKSPVFFSGDVQGFTAYFMADFQRHECVTTSKDERTQVERSEHVRCDFAPLADVVRTPFAAIVKRNGRRMTTVSQLWMAHLVVLRYRQRHGDAALLDASPAELAAFRTAQLAEESASSGQPVAIEDDVWELVVAGRGAELSPVCAVMGGLLAQEVLKAVSGKDLPLKNVVVFNGMLAEAGVQDLRP